MLRCKLEVGLGFARVARADSLMLFQPQVTKSITLVVVIGGLILFGLIGGLALATIGLVQGKKDIGDSEHGRVARGWLTCICPRPSPAIPSSSLIWRSGL